MFRGPLAGSRQPGTAIQFGLIALQSPPLLGGFGEVTVDTQAFLALFQPLTQSRPFSDQSLMVYFRAILAGDDQPSIDQGFENTLY